MIARQLLDASSLCAIATVGPGTRAYVSTAYFAWNSDFDVVWLSEPRSRHSRNLLANATTAIAVYDSDQAWGEPDRGIQLFGSAHSLDGEDAEGAALLYAQRFPAFGEARQSAYCLYRFRPRRLKLFHERAFGVGTFVTAAIARGGRITWEKTEIYRLA
jgi:uncharacterized protein YhbP (UPF0306 family)